MLIQRQLTNGILADALTKQKQFIETGAILANAFLGGVGLALILTLFDVFYHYTWTGERQFGSSAAAWLYYGIPAVLAALLFGSLRFKPSWKINIAILSFSVVASLYAAELFFHLADSFELRIPIMTVIANSNDKNKEAAKFAKKFGVPIDPREVTEVIGDLLKKGIDAVPSSASKILFVDQPDGTVTSAISIAGTEVIPFGAISNRVTVLLCNENGYFVSYETDEHGFPNPRGIWNRNDIDIAAVGDSYLHGYCVPPHKTLAAPIRHQYPLFLNLGMAGDGPLFMLAKIKEYLPVIKPKLVLWFYYEGNDLTDLQNERKNKLLMNYLKHNFTQDLLSRQAEIDKAIIDDLDRQSDLFKAIRQRREENSRASVRFLGILPEFLKLSAVREKLNMVQGILTKELEEVRDLQGQTMDLFTTILLQAKSSIGSWGGKLVFIYLPAWERYALNQPGLASSQRDRVLMLASNLQIPMIDIHPVFQAQSDPLSLFPFREPGHYNELGHRLVGEEVRRVLSGIKATGPPS